MQILFAPGFDTHPAVMAAGSNGTGLYVRLISWSVRHETDAWTVPASLVNEYGTPAVIRRMLAAGLAAAVSDGYRLRSDLFKTRRDDSRTHIPAAVRTFVMDRDGHRCVECSATEDLTLDHIYPWSLGGPDTKENLRVLCRPCNSSKGARV